MSWFILEKSAEGRWCTTTIVKDAGFKCYYEELMKNKNVIGLILQLFQSSFHILLILPLSYSILNSRYWNTENKTTSFNTFSVQFINSSKLLSFFALNLFLDALSLALVSFISPLVFRDRFAFLRTVHSRCGTNLLKIVERFISLVSKKTTDF